MNTIVPDTLGLLRAAKITLIDALRPFLPLVAAALFRKGRDDLRSEGRHSERALGRAVVKSSWRR